MRQSVVVNQDVSVVAYSRTLYPNGCMEVVTDETLSPSYHPLTIILKEPDYLYRKTFLCYLVQQKLGFPLLMTFELDSQTFQFTDLDENIIYIQGDFPDVTDELEAFRDYIPLKLASPLIDLVLQKFQEENESLFSSLQLKRTGNVVGVKAETVDFLSSALARFELLIAQYENLHYLPCKNKERFREFAEVWNLIVMDAIGDYIYYRTDFPASWRYTFFETLNWPWVERGHLPMVVLPLPDGEIPFLLYATQRIYAQLAQINPALIEYQSRIFLLADGQLGIHVATPEEVDVFIRLFNEYWLEQSEWQAVEVPSFESGQAYLANIQTTELITPLIVSYEEQVFVVADAALPPAPVPVEKREKKSIPSLSPVSVAWEDSQRLYKK